MSVITFRVERSDSEPSEGERSRNVDIFCKTVLRLRDFDLHSISPLRTKLYNGDQLAAWKRSAAHHTGELCS